MPPLALLAAILVRTPRALAVVLVVLVPWSVAQPARHPPRPPATAATTPQLMRTLDALPRDAQVISDEPGFVYRAGPAHPEAA